MQASQNNGHGQPMHLPTTAVPWAACELDAQQVLCYCHSYVHARQAWRFISQLLINPHMLRKPTALAPCLPPAMQSSWALLFFCMGSALSEIRPCIFIPKSKNNFISVRLFFLSFLHKAVGKDTAHAKQGPRFASFAQTQPQGLL